MAYLLDTNVVSELRKGRRCETAVREWFDALDEGDAYLSVLVVGAIERSIERDHFALARAHNMAILPWSPLASGLLTGKYDRGADADGAAARLRDTPRGGPILKEPRAPAVVISVADPPAELGTEIGRAVVDLYANGPDEA